MKRTAATAFACLLIATAAFAQHDHTAMHATMNHDQMFADTMTTHHRDGIRMAQMAVEKAESAELRSMAQKMIDDQNNQIDRMQSLRGEGPMTPKSEMMAMSGMMPESEMQRDMARLEAARGRDFDLAFTEIMAKHHAGAVEMSNHELKMGTSEGMKAIAREIADMQSRERQQLMAMHDDLSAANAAMTSSASERRRMTKD